MNPAENREKPANRKAPLEEAPEKPSVKGSWSDLVMMATIALTILVITIVAYAIFNAFDVFAFMLTIVIVGLIWVGFHGRLKAFSEHDTIHWTATSLLIVFISAFEHTKADKGFYFLLSTTVLVCIVSFFMKTILFTLVGITLFSYIASTLIVSHIRRLQSQP